jgi:signal transduction histidine kinase
VRDDGIGIPPEEQESVFLRFFRGGHPLVQGQRGSGLGLSITRSLVGMQGGSIWFESEPGRGTAFTFSLPAAI